jgi:ATP-dependent Clp protease ATP-binding subunit ClpA
MTTNAGAADMARPPMGFNRAKREGEDTEAVTKLFTPEFRNRLDAIVPFSGLSPEIIAQVVEKFIFQLEAQLADRGVSIELSNEATSWLAEKGYDDKFGARPLARVIQEHIKKPLAEELLFGKLENGGTVKVLVKGNGPDRELAFEFLPLDPAKRSKVTEEDDGDDDGPQPVLADATPKKALPGPKEKADKPKETGAVPSVPRKKKDD